MFGTRFSLLIVPESTGRVIRKHLTGWKIIAAATLIVFLFITLFGFTIGFFKRNVDHHKLATLKRENRFFAEKIKDLQESVELIKGQMAGIIKKDENIRLVFDLPSIDPSIREVGIGGRTFETADIFSPLVDQVTVIENDIEKILRQIKLENASFTDVYDKLQNKRELLDHTPSIMPVEGFITRGIGMQINPVTGFYQMHNGVDISAERGTPIHAPAAGRVVSAGWDQGLGNSIVIDHGFGMVTVYGHLSLIKVRRGDTVKRMDVIGFVGSTGQSTGPHLHYEVRKNGQPVNPMNFAVKTALYTP